MLRFETAGESHGECLVATINGLPAGIPISLETVNRELWRRQQGYGRGGRMKIETDRAEIVAGVRHSHTIGSPVAILIRNQDWQNWTEALPVEDIDGGKAVLGQFGMQVLSHAIAVGPVRLERTADWDELVELSRRDEILLGCVDAATELRMKEVVDHAYRTGDTVGGVFEVVARGVPVGLGSHVTWDSRLDGRLAQAIVSIQAVGAGHRL